MKSSEDTKIETAYNHAFNYYKQHGRSLDHQNACINQMIGLTGFDRATCIEIQSPVQSIMMYNETVELSHTIIQQQLNTVTGIIRGRLLDINHGKIQEQKVSKIPEYSTGVKGTNFIKALLNKSKITQSEDLTVLSFDGIKDQNPQDGRFKAAVGTVLKIVDDTRYTDNSISNKTKVISMNNCGLEDYDLHCLSPIFEYSLNIDYFSLANNNIKTGSKILREYHHANLYKNGVNCSIKHLNLSNNLIDDTSASIIASHIQKGEVPHLKTLDVSGNLLTKVGEGYLANAVTKMSQNCAILVKKMEIIGVESFKSTIKVMLDIAKSNGISTKEVLTNAETIEHCKKGIGNVSKNLFFGYVKCFTSADTPIAVYEMDLQTLLIKTVGGVLNPTKKPAQFVCATQETVFSVVDEEFANCLTGLDSGLSNE